MSWWSCIVFLMLFVIFSIIIGIFVSVLFRRLFPPGCAKCEQHDREVRVAAAIQTTPAVLHEESDVED